MKPRPDQETAIAFTLDAVRTGTRAVLQLPTGSGKTLCALLIARRFLGPQRRVYLLTPSLQSLTQTIRLGRLLGICVVADQGDRHASRFAQIIASTYATAWSRHERIPTKETLLILDECHHINYLAPINVSMLNRFGLAIGLSATPWSVGCQDYFHNHCHVLPLSESIAAKINCDYEIRDWHAPSGSGRYQVIYSNYITPAHPLLKGMRNADYAICKRRQAAAIVERFRRGFVGTLLVDRMLTEGFDLKQIKAVYVDKQVKSRILLMQMLGRALRPFEGRKAMIAVRNDETRRRLEQAIKRAG